MSRTLVVGDVHGCADELEALVARAAADRVVLVGDLYTKGPDPVGVWHQIRAGGWDAVLGNHDQAVLDAADGKGSDPRADHVCEILQAADPKALPWLRRLPLFLEVDGFTVVHAGLHPSGDLQRTTRQMALTMRDWPLDDPRAIRWHAQYTGARRVIFGHDARQGLVRVERHGQPWLIGLDTGCVYGGRLSGYLIQEDRIVKVKATKVHQRV